MCESSLSNHEVRSKTQSICLADPLSPCRGEGCFPLWRGSRDCWVFGIEDGSSTALRESWKLWHSFRLPFKLQGLRMTQVDQYHLAAFQISVFTPQHLMQPPWIFLWYVKCPKLYIHSSIYFPKVCYWLHGLTESHCPMSVTLCPILLYPLRGS